MGKGRGQYLVSVFKPGTRSQVPAEGAGEYGSLSQLHRRVSQAPGEVAHGG